ncbi:MAG: hypothetical protein P4M07_02810, partial [Xanthobacteraceae bacterium]|nr:hypothetical protein [Xanthobacteraceae bacterium]
SARRAGALAPTRTRVSRVGDRLQTDAAPILSSAEFGSGVIADVILRAQSRSPIDDHFDTGIYGISIANPSPAGVAFTLNS